MAPLNIYWGGGSPFAWRVLAGLEEKGITYDAKLLDVSKKGHIGTRVMALTYYGQEHKEPEYLALNPRGQMPILVDGDIVVSESLAALLYLDEAYPKHPLLPSDKRRRALAYQRSVESSNLQDKALQVIRLKRSSPSPDPAEMQKVTEALKDELELWDGYTQDSFAAGCEFTLADTAAGPYVLALKHFGASLKDYPNLAKYSETIGARPAFQTTFPPQWKDSPNPDWLSDV